MVDWREISWWDLPGPSRFVERAASAVLTGEHGAVGLMLPSPPPAGLLDALSRRISEASGAVPVGVDASAGLRGRSPVHMLSASAGVAATAIRSVADFVDAPGLANVVFVVEGIHAEEWMTWGLFLRQQRAERARRPRALAPAICIVVPGAVAPDDVKAALGVSGLRWLGVTSRLDSQLHTERLTGFSGDDLLARTAVSTIVEVAGWDPSLICALADLPPEVQLDPRDVLRRCPGPAGAAQPCWANGLVDHWDGQVHVHAMALLNLSDDQALSRRVWRGHVRTVFPFIDQVRHAFVRRYESALRARLPLEKNFHTRVVIYDDPFALELFDVNRLLADILPEKDRVLLSDCYRLRTALAHIKPAETHMIVRASRLWEELSDAFDEGRPAWDWPRCGQKLVLIIGPSGAGKTTWADRHYDSSEIVSSDRIREEIFGSAQDAGGDQEPVFRRLRREVVARLAAGRNAVIDATNLRKDERLANALLAPPDMSVEYVVVDRPMEEKIASAGWRAHRPGLLETHARLFEDGLTDILAGDGLANVRLLDERKFRADTATRSTGTD
jgi:hypothetical protein